MTDRTDPLELRWRFPIWVKLWGVLASAIMFIIFAYLVAEDDLLEEPFQMLAILSVGILLILDLIYTVFLLARGEVRIDPLSGLVTSSWRFIGKMSEFHTEIIGLDSVVLRSYRVGLLRFHRVLIKRPRRIEFATSFSKGKAETLANEIAEVINRPVVKEEITNPLVLYGEIILPWAWVKWLRKWSRFENP